MFYISPKINNQTFYQNFFETLFFKNEYPDPIFKKRVKYVKHEDLYNNTIVSSFVKRIDVINNNYASSDNNTWSILSQYNEYNQLIENMISNIRSLLIVDQKLKFYLITMLLYYKYNLIDDSQTDEHGDYVIRSNIVIPLKQLLEILAILLINENELITICDKYGICKYINTEIILPETETPFKDVITYLYNTNIQYSTIVNTDNNTISNIIISSNIDDIINSISQVEFNNLISKYETYDILSYYKESPILLSLIKNILNLIQVEPLIQISESILFLIEHINQYIKNVNDKITLSNISPQTIVSDIIDFNMVDVYVHNLSTLIYERTSGVIEIDVQKIIQQSIQFALQSYKQILQQYDLENDEYINYIIDKISFLNILAENENNFLLLQYIVPHNFTYNPSFDLYLYSKQIIEIYQTVFFPNLPLSLIIQYDYFVINSINIINIYDTMYTLINKNKFLHKDYVRKYLMQYILIGDKYYRDALNIIDDEYFINTNDDSLKHHIVNLLQHIQQITDIKKTFFFGNFDITFDYNLKHKLSNYMVNVLTVDESLFNVEFKRFVSFIMSKYGNLRQSQLVNKILYIIKSLAPDTTQELSHERLSFQKDSGLKSYFYSPRRKYPNNIISEINLDVTRKSTSPYTILNHINSINTRTQLFTPLLYSIFEKRLSKNVLYLKSKVFENIDIEQVIKSKIQNMSNVNVVLEKILTLVKEMYFILPNYLSMVLEQILSGSKLSFFLVLKYIPQSIYDKIKYTDKKDGNTYTNIHNIIYPFEIQHDINSLFMLYSDDSNITNVVLSKQMFSLDDPNVRKKTRLLNRYLYTYLLDTMQQEQFIQPYYYYYAKTTNPLIDIDEQNRIQYVNTSKSLYNTGRVYIPLNGFDKSLYIGNDTNNDMLQIQFLTLVAYFSNVDLSSALHMYRNYILTKFGSNKNQKRPLKVIEQSYNYIQQFNTDDFVQYDLIVKQKPEYLDTLNTILDKFYHDTIKSSYNSEKVSDSKIHRMIDFYKYVNSLNDYLFDNQSFKSELLEQSKRYFNRFMMNMDNPSSFDFYELQTRLEDVFLNHNKQVILEFLKYSIYLNIIQFGHTYSKDMSILSYLPPSNNLLPTPFFWTQRYSILTYNTSIFVDSYTTNKTWSEQLKNYLDLRYYYMYRLFEDDYINNKNVPTWITNLPIIYNQFYSPSNKLKDGYTDELMYLYPEYRFTILNKLYHPYIIRTYKKNMFKESISDGYINTYEDEINKRYSIQQESYIKSPVYRTIIEAYETFGGDLYELGDSFPQSQSFESKPLPIVSVPSIDIETEVTEITYTNTDDIINTYSIEF